tara:strand:+ start:305 stop:1429 length:1125 start_codon:yes stop_codon:yes gene_type:complete
MAGWLTEYAPRTFDQFAAPSRVLKRITALSLLPQPPHLLITGPPGSGKTALWRLYARQVLGPSWTSRVHVRSVRDMKRTRGAMDSFEQFLRPQGKGSSDTLAGMTSLAAFPSGVNKPSNTDPPPAGRETSSDDIQSLSRLIILEDADHMSLRWQSYLRRMMETVGSASRFIFTARAPSAIIDALRSRTQMIRIPACGEEKITKVLDHIIQKEGCAIESGIIEDISYMSQGNLRRAIFTLELLWAQGELGRRSSVHDLMQAATMQAGRDAIEKALRGQVADSKWIDRKGRRTKIRVGAVAEIDALLNDHGLDPDDVVDQMHSAIVSRRLPLSDSLRNELLQALAECSKSLQTHTHPRIHFEHFLHQVARAGQLIA